MMHLSGISEERRELLNFDAIRVGLNYVHGLERQQLCRSLREAGMVRYRALDGCECWHWPGPADLLRDISTKPRHQTQQSSS